MKLKQSAVLLGALIVIALSGCSRKPDSSSSTEDWMQGGGPAGNFVIDHAQAPLKWSVADGENIAWRLTLPETGQSTVVTAKGKLFFTIMKPVEADS